MALVDCPECKKEISDRAVSCPNCGCPQGLNDTENLINEVAHDELVEAEDYHLQAEFILHELQANLQVYGSNSMITGATPANIDLALKYVDRSLLHFPESPKYLNTRALLLSGAGRKAEAVQLLEKAHKLAPRDITIESNLNTIKSNECFVATATFGHPMVREINTLRRWRGEYLLKRPYGRNLNSAYNRHGPKVAKLIRKHKTLRKISRFMLRPVIWLLKWKYPH